MDAIYRFRKPGHGSLPPTDSIHFQVKESRHVKDSEFRMRDQGLPKRKIVATLQPHESAEVRSRRPVDRFRHPNSRPLQFPLRYSLKHDALAHISLQSVPQPLPGSRSLHCAFLSTWNIPVPLSPISISLDAAAAAQYVSCKRKIGYYALQPH